MAARTKLIVLFVFSAILIILGFVLGFAVFPSLVDDTINEHVRLEYNTPQYARFESLPFPLLFKVYLFNITNVDDIRLRNAKPIVNEVGPYVYREFLEKKDINNDYLSNTIDFLQYRRFVFDKEASAPLTEQDELNLINVPLLSVQQTLPEMLMAEGQWDKLQFVEETIPVVFRRLKEPFLKVSVQNYLWKGIRMCEKRAIDAAEPELYWLALMACRYMIQNSKNVEDYNSGTYYLFSFLKYKTTTHDGKFTINNGMESIEDLGKILKWNDQETINVWANIENGSQICNKIRGLDSTVYPPRLNDSLSFDIYATDICRTSTLRYKEETRYEGISGLRYQVTEDEFSPDVPENECYCINKTTGLNMEKGCLPKGFVDLNNCLHAPILGSNPHMLWGDDAYFQSTEGQMRNLREHVSFVDLEPITGSPIRGSKKIQFNMVLRPVEWVNASQIFDPPSVIPILWVDESMELPIVLVDEVKSSLSAMDTVDIIAFFLIGVGVLIIISALLGMFLLKYDKDEEDTPQIEFPKKKKKADKEQV